MKISINFRDKKFRLTAVLLMYAGVFLLVFYGALGIISQPFVCSGCHMMNPEYYTWQASSHGRAGVKCRECHIPPGPVNFVKYNFLGLKNVYSAFTGSFVSPVKMLKTTPDSACQKCHDQTEKTVTSKGMLIVSHDRHNSEGVHCGKCHRGVAHGLINERGLTFVTDYKRWNRVMAKSAMKEVGFVKPDMDACMSCHKVRNASRKCKTCHPDGNLRADHKNRDFKYKTHGKLAVKNITECNGCHSYMTDNKIEGLEENKKYEQYLGKTKPVITAEYYARSNKYCKDCHGKRPPSHREKFISRHGKLAKENERSCFTCHDNQPGQGIGTASVNTKNTLWGSSSGSAPAMAQPDRSSINNPVTTVTCNLCHPSPHTQSVQWKKGYHPVPLGARPKITKSCFPCHYEAGCARCHVGLEAKTIKDI